MRIIITGYRMIQGIRGKSTRHTDILDQDIARIKSAVSLGMISDAHIGIVRLRHPPGENPGMDPVTRKPGLVNNEDIPSSNWWKNKRDGGNI